MTFVSFPAAKKVKKIRSYDRTRTCNPLIWGLVRCPLCHTIIRKARIIPNRIHWLKSAISVWSAIIVLSIRTMYMCPGLTRNASNYLSLYVMSACSKRFLVELIHPSYMLYFCIHIENTEIKLLRRSTHVLSGKLQDAKWSFSHRFFSIKLRKKIPISTVQKIRSWQDSNLQSPDPKSGALSIRPHDPAETLNAVLNILNPAESISAWSAITVLNVYV